MSGVRGRGGGGGGGAAARGTSLRRRRRRSLGLARLGLGGSKLGGRRASLRRDGPRLGGLRSGLQVHGARVGAAQRPSVVLDQVFHARVDGRRRRRAHGRRGGAALGPPRRPPDARRRRAAAERLASEAAREPVAQALVLVGEPPRVGAQLQEFRACSVRVDVVRDALADVAPRADSQRHMRIATAVNRPPRTLPPWGRCRKLG